ncbi:hypothetical protein SeMB42_g02376 [Synchytrium endobioticum]|uniref:DUS-like FMN-binding domain-containing protein n=1 Tax=Synchytrium endobioticum TaxID=286115 RepID=A0A507D7G7_9FUNG|nr:hypothetical protein SeLEV6574_g02682 [Synchytrium endobioticum]TPX50077.1 hypothetical protein SeMB42_g02376 [Synchytrium endobioticum]
MLEFGGRKRMLAPMVRVNTLPFRLLALEYGADIVFSPETIDRKLLKCTRIVHPDTGIITFVDPANPSTVALRIHPAERARLVVQLGSACAASAVQAALMLKDDVGGIDLNCGCPHPFSVSGGMGAALLGDADRLCGILDALVGALRPVPVTCKIRVLDSVEDTVRLAVRLAGTGIAALHVHCRTRSERSTMPGRWDYFEHLVRAVRVPVTANGDVWTLATGERVMDTTGVAAVMLARAAHENVSVFRRDGPLPVRDVVVALLEKVLQWELEECNFAYLKYTLLNEGMLKSKNPLFHQVVQAKTLRALCEVFGLEEEFDARAKTA